MVTLEQVSAALDAIDPATVKDVRITTEADGLSSRFDGAARRKHFDPYRVGFAHSAEERRPLISEEEQRFAGRGDEDSGAWIEDIRTFRSFIKTKTACTVVNRRQPMMVMR